jgi:hypothetical protein
MVSSRCRRPQMRNTAKKPANAKKKAKVKDLEVKDPKKVKGGARISKTELLKL